jgi:molecular chaperone Hsp33
MNKDNTVRQAGGFIIQLMPFTEDVIIDKLENTLKNMKPITELLDSDMTPEMILEEVLGEFGLQINEKVETSYYCNCSKDRVHKAISSISKKDIKEMIDDNKPIEVECHFCDKKYVFEVEELKEMIK